MHRELVKAPHILLQKRQSELIEKNLLGLEAEHELFLVKKEKRKRKKNSLNAFVNWSESSRKEKKRFKLGLILKLEKQRIEKESPGGGGGVFCGAKNDFRLTKCNCEWPWTELTTARSPKGSVFYEFSPSPLLGNIAFLTSTGEKVYIIETVIACGSEPYCILMRQSMREERIFN